MHHGIPMQWSRVGWNENGEVFIPLLRAQPKMGLPKPMVTWFRHRACGKTPLLATLPQAMSGFQSMNFATSPDFSDKICTWQSFMLDFHDPSPHMLSPWAGLRSWWPPWWLQAQSLIYHCWARKIVGQKSVFISPQQQAPVRSGAASAPAVPVQIHGEVPECSGADTPAKVREGSGEDTGEDTGRSSARFQWRCLDAWWGSGGFCWRYTRWGSGGLLRRYVPRFLRVPVKMLGEVSGMFRSRCWVRFWRWICWVRLWWRCGDVVKIDGEVMEGCGEDVWWGCGGFQWRCLWWGSGAFRWRYVVRFCRVPEGGEVRRFPLQMLGKVPEVSRTAAV